MRLKKLVLLSFFVAAVSMIANTWLHVGIVPFANAASGVSIGHCECKLKPGDISGFCHPIVDPQTGAKSCPTYCKAKIFHSDEIAVRFCGKNKHKSAPIAK